MNWTIRDSNPGRSHGGISFPKRQDGICGPPRLLFNRCHGLLLSGVKRPEREADHSFPSAVEAKKDFLELYLYPACMHSWCEHGKYFFYQER